LHGVAHGARHDDPTRRRFGLEPRRDVDVIAVDIVAVDDDVPQMKAGPEYDHPFLGLAPIGLGNGLLKLDGSGEGIDRARELDQPAIALEPDHTSAMPRDSRSQPLVDVVQKSCNGTALILTHQPGRADSVHKEDRCQSALLARQMLSSKPHD